MMTGEVDACLLIELIDIAPPKVPILPVKFVVPNYNSSSVPRYI